MDRGRAQVAKRDLHRLYHRGLGPLDFTGSAKAILRRAVPFDASCWLTVDPATLLFTSGLFDYPPQMARELARNEFLEDDVNKMGQLARQRVPVGVLRATLDGHPERSPRYRDILRPAGLESELRAVYTVDSNTWGGSALYREPGAPEFDPDEAAFVADVARLVAEGFRRSMIAASVMTETLPRGGPGLIVLAGDDSVETMTPDGQRLLEELDADGGGGPARLPRVIVQVAYRARAILAGTALPEHGVARLRVLATSGRWLLIHACVLEGALAGRTAVIIQPAGPAEIAPLIVDAYGLSARERQITQLVLQGASTAEMARVLHLSPFTVQDHLKAIFEKMGVHSRREVASRIFFEHHFPPTVTPHPGTGGFVWQAGRPG